MYHPTIPSPVEPAPLINKSLQRAIRVPAHEQRNPTVREYLFPPEGVEDEVNPQMAPGHNPGLRAEILEALGG